jgi:hypothetical protein
LLRSGSGSPALTHCPVWRAWKSTPGVQMFFVLVYFMILS